MYSSLQRLNNLSTFLTTCLLALLAAVSLSSFLLATSPTGALEVAPVKISLAKTVPWAQRAEEAAAFQFSFNADLRPLFHWNTKQVFMYLSAEYTNRHGLVNEVVIWDRIVRRRQDARIRIENGQNKYLLKEHSGSFRYVKLSRANESQGTRLTQWGTPVFTETPSDVGGGWAYEDDGPIPSQGAIVDAVG